MGVPPVEIYSEFSALKSKTNGYHGKDLLLHVCIIMEATPILPFMMLLVTSPSVTGQTYSATGQSLTTVPIDIPGSVTQIDLSSNDYSSIDSGWFITYTSLTKLTMKNNQITSVAADAFDSAQPINTVDLSNNLLTALPDFRVLSATLYTITLSGNPLLNAQTDTLYLSGFSILWNFMIDNTDFQSLDPIKAMAWNQFKLLRASGANLSDIGMLNTFNNVYYMDMSYNQYLLPSLTNETFIGVDILRVLKLSGIGFTEFPADILQPVSDTLETLTLSSNNIKYVNSSHLLRYQVLKTLYLSSNQLTTFPEVTPLSGTLEFLDVSSNDIVYVEENILDGFDQINQIRMGYNRNLMHIPQFGTGAANIANLQIYGIGLTSMPINQLTQFTGATYIYPTSGNVFANLYNFTALNGTLQTFMGNYGEIGTVSRNFMDQMPHMVTLSLHQTKLTCLEEVSGTNTIIHFDLNMFAVILCPNRFISNISTISPAMFYT